MTTFRTEDDNRKGVIYILENEQTAGEISFVWSGADKFIINHTEVYDAFNGKGYGKQLVLKAIEYATEKQVKIIPLCPYAKKVMEGDEKLREMIVVQ